MQCPRIFAAILALAARDSEKLERFDVPATAGVVRRIREDAEAP
jgi:hypothetical protein